jgi:hypothetical protein
MKAGVAYGNDASGYVAGRVAAEEAVKKTGALKMPDLVLAFCAGSLQANAALAGIRSAVGARVPILGGSAVGVITNDKIAREGVCVAVLDLGAPLGGLAFTDGLEKDERKAGKKLGKQLLDAGARGSSLLVFYDTVRKAAGAAPAVVNGSRNLIAGLAEGFPGGPAMVGAGLIQDAGLKSGTWQYCGEDARQQHAVGAVLSSKVKTLVQVMHACQPIDNSAHVLTKVKESLVLEIDGRPAADRVDEITGSKDWRNQRPVNSVALGLPLGDRLTTLGDDGWCNRIIAGVGPDGKSVALFEPDFQDGAQVVFMKRDPAKVLESVRAGAENAIQRMKSQRARPRIALYIDHTGRAASVVGTATEEAAELGAILTREGISLIGFYSGVGVAPLRGMTRGFDWAGVLLLMGE